MALSADKPTVSVIVSTYNSRDLLAECLDSVARQTLPQDQIEVQVIDDGSTDGTWDYLLCRKAAWSNLTLSSQPNSGGPSKGRNRGIAAATGRYLYFLDADDWLGDDALRRLVETAESYGSDVILGRAKGMGRSINDRTFAKTVLDADPIADHAWRILAPWKLFRASMIKRLQLRFPEDQVQGEDQVFVAACYFAADKISILADYDYHYLRGRPGRENLSRQPQTLNNKLLTTTRMTELIITNTEPGPRRDAFLRRVLLQTLAPVFAGVFLNAERSEQESFLDTMQSTVLPHLSDGILAKANDRARLRLLTARLGSADQMISLIHYLRAGMELVIADGRARFDLPADVAALFGDRPPEPSWRPPFPKPGPPVTSPTRSGPAKSGSARLSRRVLRRLPAKVQRIVRRGAKAVRKRLTSRQ